MSLSKPLHRTSHMNVMEDLLAHEINTTAIWWTEHNSLH